MLLYESGTFMSLFHFLVVNNVIFSNLTNPFHQERRKTLVDDYDEVKKKKSQLELLFPNKKLKQERKLFFEGKNLGKLDY